MLERWSLIRAAVGTVMKGLESWHDIVGLQLHKVAGEFEHFFEKLFRLPCRGWWLEQVRGR